MEEVPPKYPYKEYGRRYYLKNRDKINERNKKYYHRKKNPEVSKKDQEAEDEAQFLRIIAHVREMRERDFQDAARTIPKEEIKTFMYY